MIRSLKIELRKVLSNRTFYVLTGLYVLIAIFSILIIQGVMDEFITNANNKSPIPFPKIDVYGFPNAWQNLTFLLTYFRIFLGIVAIIFVCNEYSYKTIRTNIFNGMSRWQIVSSKLLLFALIDLVITVIVFIVACTVGLMNTPDLTWAMFTEKMIFIPTFFLDTFVYLTFVMFIAQLLKRAGFSIALVLLYSYIIESLLAFKFDQIADYLPIHALNNLIPAPNLDILQAVGINFGTVVETKAVLISIAWCIIFIAANYLIVKKRDF